MRRLLSGLLLACPLVVVGVAPAHAATTPVIDSLDWTTTPGHVTGTVTADTPWVHVSFGSHGSWPGDKDFFPVDPTTHRASFDLETWGMREPSGPESQVGVTPCTDKVYSSCASDGDQPAVVSEKFQPTDSRPEVTFSPADGTLDAGDVLTVTVSDPQGGGLLKAWWAGNDGSSTPKQVLDRAGTTKLAVREGPGKVRVVRCTGLVSNVSAYYCDEFEPPIEYDAVVDTHAPIVQDSSPADPVVRPEATDATSSVDITAIGPDPAPGDVFVVHDASGTPVRTLESWIEPETAWHTTFDGRGADGQPLPAGTYDLRLKDAAGHVSTVDIPVRVERLVTKTFTYSTSARTTTSARVVGVCSTLASPASRGWSGSLGYYANTRCGTTTPSASTVTTSHLQAVPAAVSYLDVQVTAYGGASLGHGSSTAVLAYDGPAALAPRGLGAPLGFYAAPRVPAKDALRTIGGRPFVAWKVGTNAGRRYDVKAFTVSVRYLVWG